MATKIPITRPALGDAEIEAVTRVVKSGWLTQGAEVAAFEAEFAKAVGAQHAVAVSNCTVALELALRVVGVKPGDDVVTVSHSFIATANAVTTIGARPVFCDIDAKTLGMDPASLEKAITPKTRAVMCVHQIGIPCALEKIIAICNDRKIPLIEDAACAIGSEIEIAGKFQRIGRPHGLLACFSLHPRKIVTTGDGGMITTADESLAKRMKLLRQHAMSVPDTVRHHSDKVTFETYDEPAYNYRLTDLQASVGRPQLARLDSIVKERRRLADRYAEALKDNPVIAPPKDEPWARSNWQSYPLRLRDSRTSQVAVLQSLMDAGIAAKRGISNAHQEPAYAGKNANRNWSSVASLAVSEAARDETILVPLFHGMTQDEQDAVIAALNQLKNA